MICNINGIPNAQRTNSKTSQNAIYNDEIRIYKRFLKDNM